MNLGQEGKNKSLFQCAMPVRLMKVLGVKTLLITTATGGVNEKFKKGDFMLVKDHICMPALAGLSPLVGLDGPEWGSRFLSMNNIYDVELRSVGHFPLIFLNE